MVILETHIVPEQTEKQRLSDYAVGIFDRIVSRKGIKKAIGRGEIYVNGEPAPTGWWVLPGQKIQLVDPLDKTLPLYELKMSIVYEDEYLAVVNKPAGIVVSGNHFRTLEHALPYNLQESKEKDALRHPRPVHRLDSGTSGLLMVAKTHRAQIGLHQQLEERNIHKVYQALVIGESPASGRIEQRLDMKTAVTNYKKLAQVPSLKSGQLSLLELQPETGRTHQLRRHLKSIGHPILGDKQYGEAGKVFRGKGIFLSAVGLKFIHPITNEKMDFRIDPPNKFALHMKRSEERFRKFRNRPSAG